jgi:hypothetical protein
MNFNKNSGYGQAMINAIHGAVPTFGRILMVLSPSDTSGERYTRAQEVFSSDPSGRVRFFGSVADAYTEAESNNNDVIVLDGNTTHTLTSMLTVSKSRVHFVGMDWLLGLRRRYGQSTKINLGVTTAATDIATMKVTGVRCSFRGIKFTNANTVTEGIYTVADGGEYTYFENCEMYKSTKLDQTGAAELVANGDSSHYKDCYIGSTVDAISGAIIRPCVLFTAGIVGTPRDNTFENCIFARKCGNTANRFMYGAGDIMERLCLIENCKFWASATSTATPAQNVAFSVAQTVGSVLLNNCVSINAGTAMSTTVGVFVNGPVPAADTTGIALQGT